MSATNLQTQHRPVWPTAFISICERVLPAFHFACAENARSLLTTDLMGAFLLHDLNGRRPPVSDVTIPSASLYPPLFQKQSRRLHTPYDSKYSRCLPALFMLLPTYCSMTMPRHQPGLRRRHLQTCVREPNRALPAVPGRIFLRGKRGHHGIRLRGVSLGVLRGVNRPIFGGWL